MKLIYIDVETTGIDCPESGLIQLAGVVEIDGKEKTRFDFRMRPFPQDTVSDEALAVNGVSRTELASYPKPSTVFQEFIELLDKFVDRYDRTDKFFFVGYNAKFDADHLRAWFAKNGDKYFGSWFWHPPIDVMVLAAQMLIARRREMENFQLATVAKALGIEVEEGKAHDALYDVELSCKIYHQLQTP